MSGPALSDPAAIAACNLQAPNDTVSLIQITHRLTLLPSWAIKDGSTVYEIGCGQGDTTSVLATAVGGKGKVWGLDPAPLDYGAPFTLQQAQKFMKESPIGDRIQFVQADPIEHLKKNPSLKFDTAIFCHSIYYFSTLSHLSQTLTSLKSHTKKLIISEWALSGAQSHILAVLAQSFLETFKENSTSNVRTVLSPVQIKKLVSAAGWTLKNESLVAPDKDLHDGGWEVGGVLSESFDKEIEDCVKGDREKATVKAAREACVASVERIGGTKEVRSMDVWTGVFEC